MQQNYSQQAQQCLQQASKKLKPGFLKKVFGNESQRYEDAIELYKQAATFFKLDKDWQASADAFVQAANLEIKCKESLSAANFFQEAANSLKQIDRVKCIELLIKAAQILAESGKFSMAARNRKQAAEMYEQDLQYALAVESYQIAGDYFINENAETTANQCFIKVAEISTYEAPDQNEIARAIKIFEEVADKYLQNNLTKYSAKDLLFKAIMLYLSNDDVIGAEQALQKYSNKDPNFETSRENKLLIQIMEAVKNRDKTTFSQVLYEYNNLTPLDKWKGAVFVRIQNTITQIEVQDEDLT